MRLVQLISTGTLFLTISPHFQIFQLAILKIYRYPISQNIPTSFSVYYESFYESFICKSSFLHSSSRAIKKNVRLGRSLYNELFRGHLGAEPSVSCLVCMSFYRLPPSSQSPQDALPFPSCWKKYAKEGKGGTGGSLSCPLPQPPIEFVFLKPCEASSPRRFGD